MCAHIVHLQDQCDLAVMMMQAGAEASDVHRLLAGISHKGSSVGPWMQVLGGEMERVAVTAAWFMLHVVQ